jgi:putative chitinase
METEILTALAGKRAARMIDEPRNLALILAECAAHGVTDPAQVAYIIGTAWHESRLKCIREIRAKPGTVVRTMQDRYWHTGYYGRGFVQLTWKRNYEKFSKLLGIDLVTNPDVVLNAEIGAKILVMGMRDGLFTGQKLAKWIAPGREPDWRNARRVVNGTFHAEYVTRAAVKVLPFLA